MRRYNTLGPAIRAARKGKGVALQRLAHRSGLSDGQLTRIELGNRWVDEGELARICRHLGVEQGDVLASVRDDDAERLRIEYGGRLFTLSSPDSAHLVAPADGPEEAEAFADDYADCLPPMSRSSVAPSSPREAETWVLGAAATIKEGGCNHAGFDTTAERIDCLRNWPVLLD